MAYHNAINACCKWRQACMHLKCKKKKCKSFYNKNSLALSYDFVPIDLHTSSACKIYANIFMLQVM